MKSVIYAVFVFTALYGSAAAETFTIEQRVMDKLAAQRNAALNAAAVSDAKVDELTEALAKANARIKELEDKPEDGKNR